MANKVLKQHIAVFGESGSGKTVLVSSFYGAAQEPENIKRNRFNVVAANATHNNELRKNYLGMKNSSVTPDTTKFSATSYTFKIQMKNFPGLKPAKSGPFEALSLIWHDYPGEWFEQEVSGPTEAKRRLDTFKALLGSDVALLLVDSQKLLDNAGQEQLYLKSLLTNYCQGLLGLKDDLLEGGKPLVEFPRIWILALSKSDLLPNMDVIEFRDLVLEKVGADLEELRDVLAGFIESSAALSVGEDFVLLSSAKFNANKIEVTKRIGVDLILPIAAMLPFERHLRWAKAAQVGKKVAVHLLNSAGVLAGAMGLLAALAAKLVGKSNKLLSALGAVLVAIGPNLDEAIKKGLDKLKESHAEALKRQNSLSTTLTGFALDLEKAEEERILDRSLR